MTNNEQKKKALPRINLRILLLSALGLLFGIFLCFRIMFGSLRPSDFCFLLVFLVAAIFPISKRRLLCVLCAFLLFGGIGFAAGYLRTQSYLSGAEEGDYFVAGTVSSFTARVGYTQVILTDVSLNGAPVRGKLSVTLNGEGIRAGDIVSFEGHVTHNELPMSEDSYSEYLFYSNIRYAARSTDFNKVGTSKNIFLRFNGVLYDNLNDGMGGVQAQIAYALLTGNSHAMDFGLLTEVRRGGVAHIFAVSGLHIGILFATMLLVCKPLGRKSFFPAVAVAFLYTAFCSFTVSSVRALIMCAVLGGYRAIGRKYDFLQSISFAALIVLLINPADWLSAGFRLSFGACLGLALFSGSLSRLFKKIPHFPNFLASYFSANLAVQLFTFPILVETFGYFSVWGFLLNLFLIPALPVFFLTVLLFTLLALIIPPAATLFLTAPKGLLSLFVYTFSIGSFNFAFTGFSLGMGGVIFVIGMLLLSERFRMRRLLRAGCFCLLAVAFTAAVVYENVVFTGGRVYVYTDGDGAAALIRTPEVNVLIIDGDIYARDCEDFLSRRYAGTLDAVVVLSDEEQDGINHAMLLNTDCIYAKDEIETGLRETALSFGNFELGGLQFIFESRDMLSVVGEGVVLVFSFEKTSPVGGDFVVDSTCGGLKFSFGHGIIKAS